MAFDLSTWTTAKYRYSYTGESGTDRIAEIHEAGYDNTTLGSEDPAKITLLSASGRGAVQTRYKVEGEDEYAVFRPSTTTLSVYDANGDLVSDLQAQLNAISSKYAIVLREGDTLNWVGLVEPQSLELVEQGPVSLRIEAHCGLEKWLDQTPYIDDPSATFSVNEGPITLAVAISKMLSPLGYGLDFYLATTLKPLGANFTGPTGDENCPLQFLWTNELAFSGGKDNEYGVISNKAALRRIAEAFGMRVEQSGGAWHLTQVNLRHGNTYRRWCYDNSGLPKAISGADNFETFDPRVTISEDDLERTESTLRFLPAYSSVIAQHQHGKTRYVRRPGFEVGTISEAENWFAGVSPWTTSGTASIQSAISIGSQNENLACRITKIDGDIENASGFTEVSGLPEFANGDDSASVFTALVNGNTVSQTTASVYSGTSLRFVSKAFCDANWNAGGINSRVRPDYILFRLYHSGMNKYAYFKADGSLGWQTTANWCIYVNAAPRNDFVSFSHSFSDPTTADGTIAITMGPIFEDESGTNVGEPAGWNYLWWDYVDIKPLLGDGEADPEATSVVNFVDGARSNPNPRTIVTYIGDGPSAANRGALFTDVLLSSVTGNWEQTAVAHSGGATGVSLTRITGAMLLKSMNKFRKVRHAGYPGRGAVLTPLDTLNISGTLYVPHELDINWATEITGGSWYVADEALFTSDLVDGISTGFSGFSGAGGQSATASNFYNRIGSSFDTLIARESDRLATVNAAATSGTTVTCTALAYALNAGDPVFFQSKKTGYIMKRIVAADAAASATSFTVTVAFSASEPLNVGDPILPGSISGLRIDMDGVQIVNTHLKNDGTNAWDGTVDATGAITVAGTQGWIITRTGEAEFNDVTVRGTIKAGTLPVWIGKDVNGDANLHGIYINSENYWTVDEDAANVVAMRVGDYSGGQYIDWDGSNIDISASGATSKIEFTSGNNVTKIQNGLISIVNAVSSHSISVVGGAFSVTTSGNNGSYAGTGYQAGAGVDASFLAGTGNITIGTASGTLNFKLSGSATLTMPTADGTSGQVLQTNGAGALSWATVAGGTTTFTGLTDTPSAYTASGGYFVRVNATPNALEFVAPGSINVSSFNNDASYVASGANISVFTNDAGYTANTGDVVGPASATSGAVALFNGTTGKLIQNSSMTISGGTVTAGAWQGTAIAVLYGGTGATTQSGARSNLGLAIGSDVQAYDSGLQSIANLVAPGADRLLYWNNGAGNYGYLTLNISNFTNDSGYTTNTGDVVGPASATDNAVALFSGTTGKLIKNSSFTISGGTVTAGIWQGTAIAVAQGGTGATDAATARTNLGLAIGTNVQAYNSGLASIAALVDPNADRIVYWNDGASNYGYLNISSLTAATAADWSSGYTLMQSTGGSLLRFSPGEVLASIGSLSDPNADRILIWDDSTGAVKFMSLGAGLSINATPTLLTSVRVDSSELQADAITTSATSRTFQTYAPFRIAGTLYYIPLYQ